MNTQEKLDQARRDKQIANEAADKEIASLKQKIKDTEVTYSIADRFKDAAKNKFIIALVCGIPGSSGWGNNEIRFVNLKTGHSHGCCVKDYERITSQEISGFLSEHTRYWDNRKQVQV